MNNINKLTSVVNGINYSLESMTKDLKGNYSNLNAKLQMAVTCAIESDMGEYNRQIGGGPAITIMQLEPLTIQDIKDNCDAIQGNDFYQDAVVLPSSDFHGFCFARLKYAMDPDPLPEITGDKERDMYNFYKYYKRVYNTELGASTFEKFRYACDKYGVFEYFYWLKQIND